MHAATGYSLSGLVNRAAHFAHSEEFGKDAPSFREQLQPADLDEFTVGPNRALTHTPQRSGSHASRVPSSDYPTLPALSMAVSPWRRTHWHGIHSRLSNACRW
jgi:hypothetical protein